MKITDVKAISYAFPMLEYGKPVSHPTYPSKIYRNNVVKVYTDEGITGFGACGRGITLHEANFVVNQMRPNLIRSDPFEVQRICRRMLGGYVGQLKVNVAVISAVEVALWDIMGKSLEAPVYKLLGGRFREKVRVYASLAWMCWGPPKLFAEHVARCAEDGWDIVKLRGNPGVQHAVEQFKLCRDAVGNDVNLAMDLNCGYGAFTAIKLIKKLEKYDPLFIEEPIPPGNPEKLAELKRAVDVPILAGESETVEGIRALILRDAVDMINPDAGLHGGLWMVKKLSEFAEFHGIPVVNHGGEEILDEVVHLHLGASTPNHLMSEFWPRTIDTEFLTEPFNYNNGYVEAPDGPGLGVEINEEILEKYKYEEPPREEVVERRLLWGGHQQLGGQIPNEDWLEPYREKYVPKKLPQKV